jgi:flagellar motility protein MotE (MotC chaperone)
MNNMLNELREMEKQGARERAAIRRQCDADIAAIRRQKEEMINEIDRKHAETMAAIEADHEAKMQTLNDKSKEIRAAIEEAKRNNDFSKVCELLKQMTESIA